jgi:hypothetical protein
MWAMTITHLLRGGRPDRFWRGGHWVGVCRMAVTPPHDDWRRGSIRDMPGGVVVRRGMLRRWVWGRVRRLPV